MFGPLPRPEQGRFACPNLPCTPKGHPGEPPARFLRAGALRFSGVQGFALEGASCALRELAHIPVRDPYGARTLNTLRCSAALRGPGLRNTPSMAGC